MVKMVSFVLCVFSTVISKNIVPYLQTRIADVRDRVGLEREYRLMGNICFIIFRHGEMLFLFCLRMLLIFEKVKL